MSKIVTKLGKYLIKKYYFNLPVIGGKNILVEIDESKFNKQKYNCGHHVEGVWVFGIVEKTAQIKYIFLKLIKEIQ